MISGLESANLKIDRAAVHLDAIRDALREYLGSEPDSSTKHPDGSIELNFVKAPPPIISILAGEVLYQLRSALDHLAFDLVKLNSLNIQLPRRWDESCEFPLILEIPTKGNPPVAVEVPLPYNAFKRILPGISKEAFAFVESVQPYHRRDGTIGLQYLAELSNIDKHRYPHITKPHAMRRDEATVRYRGDVFNVASFVRVDDGAKTKLPLDSPGVDVLKVQVQGVFRPFVSFDESALGINAPNLPIDSVLQSCLEAVKILVIPAFEKLFKNG